MAPAVRKRPAPVAHAPKPVSKREHKEMVTAAPEPSVQEEGGSLINANQIPDKYDPAFPNDYEEYCKQRKARKHAEEAQRKRDEEQPTDTPAAVDLSLSGEEAYRRRMQMSGMAPAAPEPVLGEEESFASKMMRMQGWKPGEGLGSKGQGITSALEHKKTGRTSGAIVQSELPSAPRVQQQPAGGPPEKKKKKTVKGRPSKVVLLRNMVGPGDVDGDLQAEVAEECTKYGEVDAVSVFEVKEAAVPEDKAVRIFTKFLRQESAMKALVDLNGRFFAGRQIEVSFFPEARFNENDISPENDDFE